MLYNSNTLFQKMPDKVSFFYAQMAEKWLELSLKKFHSYIFRNNVESETVLYLTNGRKVGSIISIGNLSTRNIMEPKSLQLYL